MGFSGPDYEFQKHVFERLTNLEEDLRELREVTWPVCQGLLDENGPFDHRTEKKRFFKNFFMDEIKNLLRLKELFMKRRPDPIAELEWILIKN
jgi:hypothetical protein